MSQGPRFLSVVIPVYNSEATIGPLVKKVIADLGGRFERLQVVLVNDGSRDGSHDAILRLLESEVGAHVKYLELARNFGEHNAVLTGLRHADGDCAVIIDDDFQNPPEEIVKLTDRLAEGYDVVYSYYERKRHSWFRNLGSRFNDFVATLLLKKPRGLYLSSFKALNRFLIDTIVAYEGPYPYIDGLVLRTTRSIGTQLCRHDEREEGRSNYTIRKLVSLWLNMSTSFSFTPLRLGAYLGFAMSAFGFALAIFFIISWLVGGFIHRVPPGWASIIVTSTLFAGIQLLVLGMIGEYLGRLYMTQNRQPQAIVRRIYQAGEEARDD